jgi:hypothetical protein
MTEFFSTPDDTGEIQASELHTTLGERIGAQAGEAFMGGSRTLHRIFEYGQAAGALPPVEAPYLGGLTQGPPAPDIPIDDAKARVKQEGLEGHLQLPDQPTIKQPVLDLMVQHAHERRQYEAAVNRGPQGFFPDALGFITEIGTGMIDPVNAAAFSIPVIGEARLGQIMAAAGENIAARAGVRAGVGAAQGAVGTALLQPADWWLHTKDGQDYSFADALRSVVLGAGMGGAFHAGFGAVGDVAARARGVPLAGTRADLELRAMAGDIRAAEQIEEAGPRIAPEDLAAEAAAAGEEEVPGITPGTPEDIARELTGATTHPATRIADLPPRAREDVLRAAIADVTQGNTVRSAEMLEEAAKEEPRIAESLPPDRIAGRIADLRTLAAAETDPEATRLHQDRADALEAWQNGMLEAEPHPLDYDVMGLPVLHPGVGKTDGLGIDNAATLAAFLRSHEIVPGRGRAGFEGADLTPTSEKYRVSLERFPIKVRADGRAIFLDALLQLREAGRSYEEAEAAAAVVASRYVNRAERLGAKSPLRLYLSEGLDVGRGEEAGELVGETYAQGGWTDDEVEHLKSLVGKKSFAEIADELGKSRGQVAGKLDRLGIEAPRAPKPAPEWKPGPRAEAKPRPGPGEPLPAPWKPSPEVERVRGLLAHERTGRTSPTPTLPRLRFLETNPESAEAQKFWHGAREQQLKDLWADPNLTAAQIASRIGGVSREAVQQKAYRLGLEARKSGAPAGTIDDVELSSRYAGGRGESIQSIAADMGVHHTSVAERLKQLGEYRPSPWSDPAMVARFNELAAQGKSHGAIAQVLGLTKAQVSGRFNDLRKAVARSLTQGKERSFDQAAQGDEPRRPWPANFPDVVIQQPANSAVRLNEQPGYAAAKAGDVGAARRTVLDVVDERAIDKLRKLIGARRPTLVPVHAIEATGLNRLPYEYARLLGIRLNLDVDKVMVQANRPQRTGEGAAYRMRNRAQFHGPVEPGHDYLLVDDAVTMGGTLADLRSYIEARGGNVIGATTLMGSKFSHILAPRRATLARLREKLPQLEPWWKKTYGHGLDALTDSEANYLGSFNSTDAIRDRLAPSGQTAGGRGGPGGDGAGARGPGRGSLDQSVGAAGGADSRGRITLNDHSAIVRLFEGADKSTFMHEMGHLWLDELVRDAGQVPEGHQLKSDLETVLKWLGVDSPDAIGRDQHEQWAQGFERYLAEGKAPSTALQRAFAAFKDWLYEIYRSLKDLGTPLTDDVRAVMDRLVDSDREIATRDRLHEQRLAEHRQAIAEAASQAPVSVVSGGASAAASSETTRQGAPGEIIQTGRPQVDAVLADPIVAEAIRNPKINRENDVPYEAGASEGNDPTTNLDKHLPPVAELENGQQFDPAIPANIHEQVEKRVMDLLSEKFRQEHGREPGDKEMAVIYETAHHEFAEPAEDAWYRAKGLDLDQVNAWWAKQDKITEHEHPVDPPQDLYKKPYPHNKVEGVKHEEKGAATEWPTTVAPEASGGNVAPAAGGNVTRVRPKAGRGPRARPQDTWSLLEFLADRGIDPADQLIADLRAIVGKNKFIPGFGNLIRKGGMRLDRAREAADNAGYIQDPGHLTGARSESTIESLLQAIDREARGERVYQHGREGPQRAVDQGQRQHELKNHMEAELAREGIDLARIPDSTRARTLEIMDREGVTDPLEAYERAVMEDTEDAAATGPHERIAAAIPGWDVPDDAGAAPRSGAAAAADRSGSAGGPARHAGRGDRASPAGEPTRRADWRKLADAKRPDDEDLVEASRQADHVPEPESTDAVKAPSAAERAAAEADKLLDDLLPRLSDEERQMFEDALNKLDQDKAAQEQLIRDGTACLMGAVA